MDYQRLIMMIPGLSPEELPAIKAATDGMTNDQVGQFIAIYSANRKSGQTLLLLSLLGFLGVAGIQRFLVGQIGLGVVYLITLGFCGIGTIVDAVNANRMAAEYNHAQAVKAAGMVKMLV